jgi:hypothetical protein
VEGERLRIDHAASPCCEDWQHFPDCINDIQSAAPRLSSGGLTSVSRCIPKNTGSNAAQMASTTPWESVRIAPNCVYISSGA